jgi:hypothetical protein
MNTGLTAGLYEKPVIVSVTLAAPGVQRLPDLQGCRRLTFFPHKAPRTVNAGRVWIMARNKVFDPATGLWSGGADPVSGGAGFPVDTYDLLGTIPAYPYALQWLSPESASHNINLSDYWLETEIAGDGIEVSVNY